MKKISFWCFGLFLLILLTSCAGDPLETAWHKNWNTQDHAMKNDDFLHLDVRDSATAEPKPDSISDTAGDSLTTEVPGTTQPSVTVTEAPETTGKTPETTEKLPETTEPAAPSDPENTETVKPEPSETTEPTESEPEPSETAEPTEPEPSETTEPTESETEPSETTEPTEPSETTKPPETKNDGVLELPIIPIN